MPKPIALQARLNLTGPHNMKPVISAIQSGLSSIKANISIKLDPRVANNLGVVNQKIDQLNKNLIQTTSSAVTLNSALKGLGTTFQQLGNAKQTTSQLQKTNQAMHKTAQAAKSAKTEMEKFGEQAALAVRRFTAFTVATGVIFGFVRAIQTATSAAIDFDKELTRVSQVTGLSKRNLTPLVDEITRLSTTLGVSSTELLDVAQTLAQAGLSANDTKKALEALAKSSLAPSFDDIKNTTEAVIASMSQFEIQAKDLEDVLGSINAVSAAYATEAEDLTTVIRRVGGVFATASKDIGQPKEALNELIALFTSVRSTTRESAETIATGFRTIFSRLQRRGTIDFLRNYNIELLDTEGRFVGVYEAVRRLSQGLSQFQQGDIALAGILEELGGFRQISKTIPLIQQFAKAEEALTVAQKGQNSLTEDAIVAQQSFANQIAKVREEFLALVRSVSQSATFNVITKSILGVASALIKVTETLQPILPLLAAIAGIKLVSGITQFTSGFFGGIRSGGGAAGAGAGIAGNITGQQSNTASTAAANANKTLVAALDKNSNQIERLIGVLQNLTGRINLSVGAIAPIKRARGGLVPGSGSGDIVPANLEPGEFVVRKAAVKAMGSEALYKMNKFVTGGPMTVAETAAAKTKGRGGLDVTDANRLNVLVGSLTNPSIGGLFLRPSPGEDQNSIREKLYKSLPQNQQQIISKKTGLTPQTLQASKVISAIELNLIEPQTAALLEERMESNMVFAVNDLMKRFGAGFNIPENKAVKDILRNTGLDSILGNIFESFISSLIGNVKTHSGARIDVQSSGVNKGALTQLFGSTQAEYLDVKKTLNTDQIAKVYTQGLSFLSQFPVSLMTGGVDKINLGSTGSKLGRRKRLAGGGRAGAGDTIPAMLESGEFVLNKRSASKIGATALNEMNRVGFASGGFVHPTRKGVRQQLTLAATAQAGGAGASFVQAADQSFKDVALSNREYVAVMQRSVQLQQKGLTVEEAKNRSLAALNQVRAKELAQGGFNGQSTSADRSKDPILRAIAAGVSPRSVRGANVDNGPGFFQRLRGRFTRGPETEEQTNTRNLRRSIIGSSLVSAGFVAAGQLEGRGPAGSAAASGITSSLLIGGIATQIIGPFGLAAGAAVGLFSALDRYTQEIKNIKIADATKKLSVSLEELELAIKSGTPREIAQSFENVFSEASNRRRETLAPRGIGTGTAGDLLIQDILSVFSSAPNKAEADEAFKESLRPARQAILERSEKRLRGGATLDEVLSGTSLGEQNILAREIDLAGKGLQELRKSIEPLAKALEVERKIESFVKNINVLGETFATLNAQTQLSISLLEDSAEADRLRFATLSGNDAQIRVSTGISRTIGNIRGSNLNDINAATKSLEGSGLDSRAGSIVRDISQALRIVPEIIGNINENLGVEGVSQELEAQIKKAGLGDEITKNILDFADLITFQSEGNEKDFRKKFEEGFENIIIGSKSAKEALELVSSEAKLFDAKLQNFVTNLQEAITANKQFTSAQLSAIDIVSGANSLRAEGERRRLTDAELLSPLRERAAVLGAGRGPVGLGERIASLTDRKATLTESLRTATGDEAKKFGDELATVTSELDNAKTALELFSKDTTIAAAAQEKLSRASELRNVTKEIAGGLLGNNKAGFGKQINALGRFQDGDLNVIKTSFDDLSAAIDLQVRFLRSQGKNEEADAVEKNFERGIGAALGPGGAEIARLFALSRDEETAARELQKKAADIQILAAQETINAQRLLTAALTKGVLPGKASGGMIRGAGTGRSDSITARLSNGEFVVNAAATARHRGLLEEINNGGVPSFARGGRVFRDRFQRASLRGLSRKARLGISGTVGADAMRFAASGSFTADNGNVFTAFTRGNRIRALGADDRVGSPLDFARGNRAIRRDRRNILRGRRGFADGGLVSSSGGVLSLNSQSLGTLNSFVIAANNLATSLSALQNIPTTISLTGTHTVEVVINGASVLQNLLEGPLGNIVRAEVEASLARYDRNLKG